jgi:serine protease Do
MLSQMAAATAPDTNVKIDILRNGREETVNLTVGTMPEGATQGMPSEQQKEESVWGITVQELTPQLEKQLNLEPGTTGVVISDIESGSPADAAGLQPGDIITEVNRQAVKNLNDYRQALKAVKAGENLLLLVQRGGGAFYVVLTPPSQ